MIVPSVKACLSLFAAAMLLGACERPSSEVKSPEGNFALAFAPNWRSHVVVPPLPEHWFRSIIACRPQHCRTPAEGNIAGWTLPRRTSIRSVQDVKNRLPIKEAHRLLGLALSANMSLRHDDFAATAFENGSFGWSARRKQPHDGLGNVHYAALMMLDNEAVALDLWIPEAFQDASNATIRDLESRVRVIAPNG